MILYRIETVYNYILDSGIGFIQYKNIYEPKLNPRLSGWNVYVILIIINFNSNS